MFLVKKMAIFLVKKRLYFSSKMIIFLFKKYVFLLIFLVENSHILAKKWLFFWLKYGCKGYIFRQVKFYFWPTKTIFLVEQSFFWLKKRDIFLAGYIFVSYIFGRFMFGGYIIRVIFSPPIYARILTRVRFLAF